MRPLLHREDKMGETTMSAYRSIHLLEQRIWMMCKKGLP